MNDSGSNAARITRISKLPFLELHPWPSTHSQHSCTKAPRRMWGANELRRTDSYGNYIPSFSHSHRVVSFFQSCSWAGRCDWVAKIFALRHHRLGGMTRSGHPTRHTISTKPIRFSNRTCDAQRQEITKEIQRKWGKCRQKVYLGKIRGNHFDEGGGVGEARAGQRAREYDNLRQGTECTRKHRRKTN